MAAQKDVPHATLYIMIYHVRGYDIRRTRCKVHQLSTKICLEASHLRKKYKLSFWDELIVSAAIESNCNILYSEDMQHKMLIQNTRIINPFVNSI